MRSSRTPARHSSARPLDPRENTLRPHLHVLSSNSTVQCTLPALVHSHTPLTRLLTYSLAHTEAYFSVKRVRCGGRAQSSVRSVSCTSQPRLRGVAAASRLVLCCRRRRSRGVAGRARAVVACAQAISPQVASSSERSESPTRVRLVCACASPDATASTSNA